MLSLASQVLPLFLTAAVAVFFTSRVLRTNKAPVVKDELELWLQKSAHTIKPVKTTLTRIENEVATRCQALSKLHRKFDNLQSRALKKEQTEIARLLSEMEKSDSVAPCLQCESAEDDNELNHISNELHREEAKIQQLELSLTKAQGTQSALDKRLAKMTTSLDINQTKTERARTESASLQCEINTLQMQLNHTTPQVKKSSQNKPGSKSLSAKKPGDAERVKLEQSISALKESLNNKITESKTATIQHDTLKADITVFEEQVKALNTALNTDTHSLQRELQDSRKSFHNNICTLRNSLAEKDIQFNDDEDTDKQFSDLQKKHRELQSSHYIALKKAEQRITDLTRELNRSGVKVQNRNSDRELNSKDNQSLEKFQRETVELKTKLRELNKLLADTIAEKKALQKQLDNNDQQSHNRISDSIGITDSSAKKPAARRKKKKAS